MDRKHICKPTIGLLALSAVVLIGCLVLVSVAISGFFVTWDPCAILGAAMLLPIPTALAVQQYRGTFRGESSAAFMTAALLFVVGGMASLALVMTFAEFMLAGTRLPWLDLFLPLLGIAVLSFVTGGLNLRWSR